MIPVSDDAVDIVRPGSVASIDEPYGSRDVNSKIWKVETWCQVFKIKVYRSVLKLKKCKFDKKLAKFESKKSSMQSQTILGWLEKHERPYLIKVES